MRERDSLLHILSYLSVKVTLACLAECTLLRESLPEEVQKKDTAARETLLFLSCAQFHNCEWMQSYCAYLSEMDERTYCTKQLEKKGSIIYLRLVHKHKIPHLVIQHLQMFSVLAVFSMERHCIRDDTGCFQNSVCSGCFAMASVCQSGKTAPGSNSSLSHGARSVTLSRPLSPEPIQDGCEG